MVKDEIKWLWHAWRGNRLQAGLNASFGLVDVALQLGQVWAMKYAIDVASHEVDGDVVVAVGIFAALIAGSYALSALRIWVRNILGVKAQNRMQQRLLDTVLRLQWQGRSQMHSGDMINRLVTDVNVVVGFLTETIPNALTVLVMFVGAFLYLFSMDGVLALVVVVMLPLFAVGSKLLMRRIRRLNRAVRDSDSQVQSILQETVQNREFIKTQDQEDTMIDRLEQTQSRLRLHVRHKTKFSVASFLILNGGFTLTYLVAFLWAALRMWAGTLTFGGMTAFLQLVNKVQGPARSLTLLVPQFVNVLTSVERLRDLEAIPMERQGAPRVLQGKLGIRMSDVTFAYSDDIQHEVISHLNFDFKPGTCSVIVGETGAGKTTILRMLLALVSPQSGNVEIYGDGVAERLTPQHRANLIYVPQGNKLMSGSIRDNLLLGNLDATAEDMSRVLTMACAEFVFDLPDGLDTVISENGMGLSEGQAQRISIARALLRSGSVMIFDEATSAVDAETERRLLSNVLADRQKTVIFVTHRMAVADYADHTLKL